MDAATGESVLSYEARTDRAVEDKHSGSMEWRVHPDRERLTRIETSMLSNRIELRVRGLTAEAGLVAK